MNGIILCLLKRRGSLGAMTKGEPWAIPIQGKYLSLKRMVFTLFDPVVTAIRLCFGIGCGE